MDKSRRDYEDKLKGLDLGESLRGTENHYSEEKFWDKIMKYGKKAGKKTIYFSLLLYYTAKNPAVPKSSKMIIIGALSYLIFPIDLIPDFIPVVGLADDASVIAMAVYKVVSHIDEGVKDKAKQKLNSFFGENTDYESFDI